VKLETSNQETETTVPSTLAATTPTADTDHKPAQNVTTDSLRRKAKPNTLVSTIVVIIKLEYAQSAMMAT